MKIKNYLRQICFSFLTVPLFVNSQTMPVSLRSDISVQFVMNVNPKSDRVAKDPISKDFFYITSIGNVYQIKNINSSPYDVLVYTAADHGIDFLQGMAFLDSTLFLVGNHLIDSTKNTGIIKKAVLKPSGNRIWSTVAITDLYAQSWTWYDHGFSGIVVSPDQNYLFINSGSRTDHGEEQNNYGMYPGMREVPLTSAIFRIPINSANLFLPNDSALLAPYMYADGTRNSFDLAFDANNNLFATENSGDRDDPDELNWIRQGRHYGFPWIMGGDNNPQQYPGYVPSADKLLNHYCNCAIKNYYHNDPSFPPAPSIAFAPSVKNMGPDADKYREVSGCVNDGSTSGNNIFSFTPHRCPLGLSFDKNNILASDLQGGGFMVSYTRGGDSTGLDIYGYPGTICDPSQDLLHLVLSPDGSGEYKMQATTVVNNFNYPVDTYLDSNLLYVIEYAYSGTGRLFKVTLPLASVGVQEVSNAKSNSLYPNPSSGIFDIDLDASGPETKVCIRNVFGDCVLEERSTLESKRKIDMTGHPKGIYFVELNSGNQKTVKKIILE